MRFVNLRTKIFFELILLATFVVSRAQGQSNLDATVLLSDCTDAVNSVQALQYSAVYVGPNALMLEGIEDHPMLERTASGDVIWQQLDRWWDARNLNRCRCRDLEISTTKVPRYSNYEYTIDGEFMRSYNSASNSAIIRRQSAPDLPFSLLSLLGYGFMACDGNICQEMLRAAEVNKDVISHGDGVVEIQAKYTPSDGSYRRRVSIFVNPNVRMVPFRYVVTYDEVNTIDAQIEVTQFATINGVVTPVDGSVEEFSIELHLPDGLTSGDVNAMPKEKADEVMTRVRFEAVPFQAFLHIGARVSNVVVNEIKPISFFRMPIPDDAAVRDFSGSSTVIRPPKQQHPENSRTPATTPAPNSGRNSPVSGHLPLLVVSLVGVNAAVFFLYRLFKAR